MTKKDHIEKICYVAGILPRGAFNKERGARNAKVGILPER